MTKDETQTKELQTAMERLQGPLEVLALFKLVEEFYTKEDRDRVYAEYQRLRDADDEAYNAVVKAREETGAGPGTSWEERVQKYGEAAASEQVEPVRRALDLRAKAMRAVTELENEHHLIVSLLKAKATYGKHLKK